MQILEECAHDIECDTCVAMLLQRHYGYGESIYFGALRGPFFFFLEPQMYLMVVIRILQRFWITRALALIAS
jgi:hypothetical protein